MAEMNQQSGARQNTLMASFTLASDKPLKYRKAGLFSTLHGTDLIFTGSWRSSMRVKSYLFSEMAEKQRQTKGAKEKEKRESGYKL